MVVELRVQFYREHFKDSLDKEQKIFTTEFCDEINGRIKFFIVIIFNSLYFVVCRFFKLKVISIILHSALSVQPPYVPSHSILTKYLSGEIYCLLWG